MNAPAPAPDDSLSARELVDGALDWWREAGVDVAFSPEPGSWLSAGEPDPSEQAPPPPKPVEIPRKTTARERALAKPDGARIGGAQASWPASLAEFRQFWLTEPSLDEGGTQGRVLARGAQGAKLALLVGQPEDGDTERLLAGPMGRLLAAITQAMGLAEGETYVASVLPRPAPLPDWQALAARGLSGLTRHHLGLAAPERLVVFGRGLLPLLTDEETVPASITLGSRAVPLMVAPRLDRLARAPGHRKKFWADWLDWSSDA